MNKRICLLSMVLSWGFLQAGGFEFEAESGGVWFTQNDARIPGDTGTKFDLLDLTGDGPDGYIRLYGTYAWNERHSLRLTLAPLQVEGTGILDQEVLFKDEVFAPGVPTKATYEFNTYRLTYRWMFSESPQWRWGLGGALLVRDADIALQQGDLQQNRDDLGVVPLFHLFGEVQVHPQVSFILDVEGAWSPVGRAVDAAIKAKYEFGSGWYVTCGYRTLEGGADNDDVYTFAWLHFVNASVGFQF